MKRLSSSDSLGGLMSLCPNTTDEHSQENNHVYAREFQALLEGFDEEGCVEESGGQLAEKKRRLSVDQVKALEKNFERENKLEPERKVKLAQELGLQPRQVAVWFQNRRARWKTKQLEKDYGVLKDNFDALKHNYETLQLDNEALLKEIRELKSKMNEEGKTEFHLCVKEEGMLSETGDEKLKAETQENSLGKDATDLNMENLNGTNGGVISASVFTDFKDGSSDSTDSSAILNEDNNSPTAAISSSAGGVSHQSPHKFLDLKNGSSTSSIANSFQFSEPKSNTTHKPYQPQFVKIEEYNFFGEESCTTFFSDDQAPTLPWYTPEEWN